MAPSSDSGNSTDTLPAASSAIASATAIEPKKSSTCHTCRRQRLRCDGLLPSCRKCIKRGVECLGYGEKALLWVQPQSQRSAPSKATPPRAEESEDGIGIGAKGRKRGRPKLVLMAKMGTETTSSSSDEQPKTVKQKKTQFMVMRNRNARSTRKDELVPVRQQTVPAMLDPVDYQNQRLIFQTMEYYDQYVCPDLVLLDTTANPHRFLLDIWYYIPDLIMNLLISTTITHQAIRSRSTDDLLPRNAHRSTNTALVKRHHLSSLHHSATPLIYRYQRKVLQALNSELENPESYLINYVFGVIITLMLAEIQQSAFGSWPVHQKAARAIISKRGGFSQLVADEGGDLAYGLSIFIIFDVIGAAMSPSSLLDKRATQQLEYIGHLETTFRDGVECGFPCPTDLMACIIKINHARYLYRKRRDNSMTIDDSLGFGLASQIASFSPEKWAHRHLEKLLLQTAETSASSSSASSFTEAGGIESEAAYDELLLNPLDLTPQLNFLSHAPQDTWEDLATAFQSAVLVYCLRTLFINRDVTIAPSFSSPSSNPMEPTIMDVKLALTLAHENLLSSLHRLWTHERNDPSWCGKFTAWPLLVAGLELSGNIGADDEKTFICKSLCRLCFHLGTLSPLDAVSVLQCIWNLPLREDGELRSWDEQLGVLDTHGLVIL